MEIEIQDLKNASIPAQFIEAYLQYLKKLFEGGDISDLKEYISKSSLTNSQKSLLAQYTKQEYCRQKNISQNEYDNTVGKAVAVTAVGGAVGGLTSVGVGYGLSAVGFTTSGVAKASIAAGIQSAIGSVEAGSAFAIAQSIGAKGLFFSPGVALALTAVGAGISLAVYAGKKYYENGKKVKSQEKQENLKDKDQSKQTPTPTGGTEQSETLKNIYASINEQITPSGQNN